MPIRNKSFERFKEKLRARSARGASARTAIIDRLAALDADALRKINGRVFARLGSKGVAALATKNAVLREMADKEPVIERSTTPQHRVAKTLVKIIEHINRLFKRYSGVVRAATVMAGAIFAGAILAPLAQTAFTIWPQTTVATTAGKMNKCPRLSPLADRCVYVTWSSSLTLQDVALQLGLPLSRLTETNPYLPTHGALPPESVIVVQRTNDH
jgi:hypothetical protein